MFGFLRSGNTIPDQVIDVEAANALSRLHIVQKAENPWIIPSHVELDLSYSLSELFGGTVLNHVAKSFMTPDELNAGRQTTYAIRVRGEELEEPEIVISVFGKKGYLKQVRKYRPDLDSPIVSEPFRQSRKRRVDISGRNNSLGYATSKLHPDQVGRKLRQMGRYGLALPFASNTDGLRDVLAGRGQGELTSAFVSIEPRLNKLEEAYPGSSVADMTEYLLLVMQRGYYVENVGYPDEDFSIRKGLSLIVAPDMPTLQTLRDAADEVVLNRY
jgi:hypothetical protein